MDDKKIHSYAWELARAAYAIYKRELIEAVNARLITVDQLAEMIPTNEPHLGLRSKLKASPAAFADELRSLFDRLRQS